MDIDRTTEGIKAILGYDIIDGIQFRFGDRP